MRARLRRGVVVCGQVVQDSFVEGGQHVELSRGEQVDEILADVRDVPGRRVLDGGAASRQQADHGAAGVVGVGLAADQPVLLHAPHLVGDTALLPAQCVAQLVGGHTVPVVTREHRQDLVVGAGQARFLQAAVQVHDELMMRVHEGPPGAVFTRVQPVRFHQPPHSVDWLTHQPTRLKVEESTFSIVCQEGHLMSSISIIGTGNMARSLGALAVAGGNTVEVIGRDQSKAADLAKTLGGSATTGEFGAVPTGDIVIVALLYANVVPVVAQYGNALAGKVIVDISNPFNSAADGLAIPDGTSIAQEVAKAAPASASVVKAFNTIFGVVLAQGRPLDVFIAGDDARAKAGVAEFIESLELRPLDVGGLNMAHWLEGTGLVVMGLARHGVGNYDFTLGATSPAEPRRRRSKQ